MSFRISFECMFEKNWINKNSEYYYDNNTLQSKGSWINGMKSGAWQYFNENGTISQRGFYVNDKRYPDLNGWEYYDANGEKVFGFRR